MEIPNVRSVLDVFRDVLADSLSSNEITTTDGTKETRRILRITTESTKRRNTKERKDRFERPDPKKERNRSIVADVLRRLGEQSATAQNLPAVITTPAKFAEAQPSQTIYVAYEGSNVLGFLKTGKKHLFVTTPDGKWLERDFFCVLDFYVVEACQRRGIGKLLFDTMLTRERVEAAEIAYDRPSPKLIPFLFRHYKLRSYVPQNNNYVVFDAYYRRQKRAVTTTRTDRSDTSKRRRRNDGGQGDAIDLVMTSCDRNRWEVKKVTSQHGSTLPLVSCETRLRAHETNASKRTFSAAASSLVLGGSTRIDAERPTFQTKNNLTQADAMSESLLDADMAKALVSVDMPAKTNSQSITRTSPVSNNVATEILRETPHATATTTSTIMNDSLSDLLGEQSAKKYGVVTRLW